MELSPLITSAEKMIKRYSVVFTLVVMYQGLFGGLTIGKMPERINVLKDNVTFKLFTLFCVAFTATKDIEISVISLALFIGFVNALRTPEERVHAGNFLNL